MSKQFKGKDCVYCARSGVSETGDHVFARSFFLPPQRKNLPQVPSCIRCNREKSELEHYLAALLPFGGRHSDASANLTTMVPRRLVRNRKLHLELEKGIRRKWIKQSSGLYIRALTLPFDGARLEELAALIVKGLMWHHWRTLLTSDCFVDALCLTATGEEFLSEYAAMRAKRRVTEAVGDGTFVYRGAQGVDNRQVSVWEFSVFGGVRLFDEGASEESSKIGVITGPLHVKESAAHKARYATSLHPA